MKKKKVQKKNTVLYIDENLVSLAKKFKLNLSQITESAIKSHLYPFLPAGERQLFFLSHIEELKRDGMCFFLSAAIKSIQIKNVRLFKDLKLTFKEGINIIYGPNSSGKTTLIRIIAEMNELLEKTSNGKEKTIRIEFSPESKISIEYYNKKTDKHECVLLDEPVERLVEENKKQFLSWLKKEYAGSQIILTTIDEEFSHLGNNRIVL